MASIMDVIRELSAPSTPVSRKRELGSQFSHEFGWRPNDFLELPGTLPAANLVVERGLDNSAMLSFLPSDRQLENIRGDERREILSLSYNSLIDWHIWIDQEMVQCFYNRSRSAVPFYAQTFDQFDRSALERQTFDEATGQAPNPNLPPLDSALLGKISDWRDILRLEIPSASSSVSALFNAIILARAVEDFDTRMGNQVAIPSLLDLVRRPDTGIGDAIRLLLDKRDASRVPYQLLDRETLKQFNELSFDSKARLVEDFYRHDAVPYAYDFSVMSKYALSKLYERYVAVMKDSQSVQLSMLPAESEEEWNRQLGGVYTPQYIASFFSRYLRGKLPGDQFIRATVVDPACGSGIFLRSVMEQKLLSGSSPDSRDPSAVASALDSVFGVDVDKNAVSASGLSLALLHLAALGKLPESVPIVQGDSIGGSTFASESPRTIDAVIVNPPFVRTELQSAEVRRAISEKLMAVVKGRLDTYQAFLFASIEALRPGGFACFIVPQPLLTSDNLKPLRDWILDQAWVHLIADLSAIRIFQSGVYVVLLVVQKKAGPELEIPPLSVIRCRRDVGLALDDFLDGNYRRTSSYSIFTSRQQSLSRPTWSVPLPEEASLLDRLESFPHLGSVANVRQGIITGADDVFVLDSSEVPSDEETVYRPFLPERMIGQYALPEDTGKKVFYPFVDGVQVDTSQMQRDFPVSWNRINQHRDKLASRASARRDTSEWWKPSWPRSPGRILVPKIVVPKICLVPRFGVDLTGQWIVSHSPFVSAHPGSTDENLLFLLAAVLNSSAVAWYIDLQGKKFQRGYSEITVSLLRRMPIPDFGLVQNSVVRQVIDSVRKLVSSPEGFDQEAASSLDDLVLRELYLLDDKEIQILRPW